MTLTPEQISEMAPVVRHGNMMSMHLWAWRCLLAFIVFLLAGAMTTFGVGLNDYFRTRSLVWIHETERQEIKLAKAQAALQANERLAAHDVEIARHDGILERMVTTLEEIKRDIAVIKVSHELKRKPSE